MTPDWRAPVNQLLYSLTYTKNIDDEAINFSADSAVQFTALSLGPDVYYEAITRALASGEHLDELSLLPQFDETQIADFLRAVAARLDELRPWTEPEVRPLDPRAWVEFAHAKQIAELEASVVQVTNMLQQGFSPVGDSRSDRQVLMLRLRTGETIALVGAYGPSEKVALMTDASDDPLEVIAHFAAATGFPADKLRSVGTLG
jgi:hypothetical protein